MESSRWETARAPRQWYAGYTKSRHEKRVDTLLRERKVEAYLPVVPRERQWHDRTKVVEFPLFPGYLFIRSERPELPRILSTPGLVSIVGINGRPAPISEDEIENVRRFANALAASGGEGVDPAPLIDEGMPVRVVSGPFRGIRGIVVEHRGKARALIQIGVRAIRQGVKVEVDAGNLETIDD